MSHPHTRYQLHRSHRPLRILETLPLPAAAVPHLERNGLNTPGWTVVGGSAWRVGRGGEGVIDIVSRVPTGNSRVATAMRLPLACCADAPQITCWHVMLIVDL